MTTYSREYLRGLKKAEEMMQYNNKVNEIVSTVSKAIIFSAKRGSTELTIDTIVVSNIEMIHHVIDKLKIQFFDSDIEYVESKVLSGILLQCVIRVKWNEVPLENIESRTQKEIQDENIKNGLARRKRIIEQTTNKIKELEEEIAVKRNLINKLTGLY
jgi:hypothetical protein